MEVYKYVKRRNRLQANLEKSYALILGQCTELTHMKLEGLPEWESTYDISDGIKLLKMIESLAHQATDQEYYPHIPLLINQKRVLFTTGTHDEQHTAGRHTEG